MTKFIASLRNVEVLYPNRAYAVTMVVTKEKGGMVLVGGKEIPGEQVDLPLSELEQFMLQRLNVSYDVDPESVDSSSQPAAN